MDAKYGRTGSTKQAIVFSLVCLLSSVPAFPQDTDYTFRTSAEIVLVNVTVRDKDGNPVRDLRRGDFTVLEDNKAQQVLSFDLENTDVVLPNAASELPLLNSTQPKPVNNPESESALKNRRLIVLFFDLSSMQPDEIERAVFAAVSYTDKQMTPADLVSIVSLGNQLTINQDFTSDRAQLKKMLQSFSAGSAEGFNTGSTGSTEGTADTGQSFTADETEFNIFNTDRRLEALRSVADKLAHVDEKKSLIYFSGGMDRTGIENQSQLRAATNAAVRANLAIYTMDIRGLQAVVPGGEAQNASLRGTSPYSGKSVSGAFDTNASTQETLVTLAGDTGGRAYLDSNDFGKVFTGVQQDTSVYYLLGYHSTNPARDGRYRKITVRVNRPGVKLDFRRGYYAPADFQHSTHEDRERQLEEELQSDLPSTDLQVYLGVSYFRISNNKYYVPVSLVVPGSQIPFTRNSDQDRATIDVLGVVTDPDKRPAGEVRDTVKLAINTSELVQSKNVQYDNRFELTPGKYHLKFEIRENQTGRIGSFETDFTIPDLKSVPVKMSSVVLANQLRTPSRKKTDNPLSRDGSEIIPSVTHVFKANQHLYLYYEVYDPARITASGAAQQDIHLITNVAFFRGKSKAYETPLVVSHQLNAPDRHASVFQLDVPLSQLKPGFYTCQVNVIDDAAGQFRFPRLAMLVRP